MSEAWTRKEGKSPSGGLNAKGRASYSKGTLKAPVTQSNPKGKAKARRKSFCARMCGMKRRLTSAKTARENGNVIVVLRKKLVLLAKQRS